MICKESIPYLKHTSHVMYRPLCVKLRMVMDMVISQTITTRSGAHTML